jgi:hypothetical protein
VNCLTAILADQVGDAPRTNPVQIFPVPHALVLDVEDTDTPALTWPYANQLR